MRLLSYNIHKGIGGRDRQYRLERILEVIEREKPDLFCLQEVDRNVRRSNHDDQPRILSRALDADYDAFQFNHKVRSARKIGLRYGGYGNLVLSRWPIAGKFNVSLRMKSRKNRRGQVVFVETPAGLLRLVNWHLGLGEKERQWQVRKLLTSRQFEQHNDVPTLVAGDSNDWRNTLHRGALNELELVQVTAPPSRFRSFPAYMPVGALDKAFRCNRIKIDRAHVVKTKLARQASDHLPLVVDFKFG